MAAKAAENSSYLENVLVAIPVARGLPEEIMRDFERIYETGGVRLEFVLCDEGWVSLEALGLTEGRRGHAGSLEGG